MKIHNDFTLYFRVTPSGKRVVYFYAYDENGRRTQGRSTGQTTKTAARVLVNRLLKEGALLPKKDVKCHLRLFCIGFLLTELNSFCPTFIRLSAPSLAREIYSKNFVVASDTIAQTFIIIHQCSFFICVL
jgi:hypothetical protein